MSRRTLLLICLGGVAFALGMLASRGRWRPPTFEQLSRLPGSRLADFYSVPRPVLERLARRACDDPQLLYGSAELLSQSGHHHRAIEVFERCLVADPDSVRLRARVLSAYLGCSETPRATERIAAHAERGLELDPNNALFDYVLALVEFERANPTAAWASLDLGLEKPSLETYNADAARGAILALRALGYSDSAALVVGTYAHAHDFAAMLGSLASHATRRAAAPETSAEDVVTVCEALETVAGQIEARSRFITMDLIAIEIRRNALERLRDAYDEDDPTKRAEVAARLETLRAREAHLNEIQQVFGTPVEGNPLPLQSEKEWKTLFEEVLERGEVAAFEKEWEKQQPTPEPSPGQTPRDAPPPL